MNNSRRNFLRKSAFWGSGLIAAAKVSAPKVSAQYEHHGQAPPQAQSPPRTEKVAAPVGNAPVVTPDIPKLPWKMENGIKVFRLTAEVVKREFLPASSMMSG